MRESLRKQLSVFFWQMHRNILSTAKNDIFSRNDLRSMPKINNFNGLSSSLPILTVVFFFLANSPSNDAFRRDSRPHEIVFTRPVTRSLIRSRIGAVDGKRQRCGDQLRAEYFLCSNHESVAASSICFWPLQLLTRVPHQQSNERMEKPPQQSFSLFFFTAMKSPLSAVVQEVQRFHSSQQLK